MSEHTFENLLIKSIEQQLNAKLNVFWKTKVLMHNSKEQLVPLAAVTQTQQYKYGDLILDRYCINIFMRRRYIKSLLF